MLRLYYARVTESKNKSIHFVLRKKCGKFIQDEKKLLFEKIDVIAKSIFISFYERKQREIRYFCKTGTFLEVYNCLYQMKNG